MTEKLEKTGGKQPLESRVFESKPSILLVLRLGGFSPSS